MRFLRALMLLVLAAPLFGDVTENVQYIPLQRATADRPGVLLNNPFGTVAGGVNARWDNLIAGWHMDETSTGVAQVDRADVLGVYTLTDTNTVASIAGLLGNAALFDTTNSEYLSNATLAFTGSDYTLAVWVKPTTIAANKMLLGCETANTGFRAESRTTGGINMTVYDGTGGHAGPNSFASSLVAGSWSLVFIWSDYAEGKTYIQVNLAAPVSTAFVPAAGTGLFFGRSKGVATYFNGAVDEGSVFNVVKSDAWRTDMYNSGAGRAYPD